MEWQAHIDRTVLDDDDGGRASAADDATPFSSMRDGARAVDVADEELKKVFCNVILCSRIKFLPGSFVLTG